MTGILEALIPVLLIGGLLWLFIWTLVDALKLTNPNRVPWVIVIIVFFPIASIVYLIIRPRPKV